MQSVNQLLRKAGVFPSILYALDNWFDPRKIQTRADHILHTGQYPYRPILDVDAYGKECADPDNRYPMLSLRILGGLSGHSLTPSLQFRYPDKYGNLVFRIGGHSGEYSIPFKPSRGGVGRIRCEFNGIKFRITELWEYKSGRYRFPFGESKHRLDNSTVEYTQNDYPDETMFLYTLGETSSLRTIIPAYMAVLIGYKDFDEFYQRQIKKPDWWRKNRDFYLRILMQLFPILMHTEKPDECSVDILKTFFEDRYIPDASAMSLYKIYRTFRYLLRENCGTQLSVLGRIFQGDYKSISRLNRRNPEEWKHVAICLQNINDSL